MIKSHKGILSIKGNKVDTLIDFAHIYSDLIKVAPEIVQAVVIHYQDYLLDAKIDEVGFVVCESILNTLANMESEDKGDESSIL